MGIACAAIGYGGRNPFLWDIRFIQTVDMAATKEANDVVHNQEALDLVGSELARAETLCGFNLVKFDKELIEAFGYKLNPSYIIDSLLIAREGRAALDKVRPLRYRTDHLGEQDRETLKLDALCRYTTGDAKKGDGVGALEMLWEGEFELLKNYNIWDVYLHGLIEYWIYLYGFVCSNYRLIPCSVPGGAPPWEWPGSWPVEKFGNPDPKKAATRGQIQAIQNVAGPYWRPCYELGMAEASSLMDCLFDWNKRKADAKAKKAKKH